MLFNWNVILRHLQTNYDQSGLALSGQSDSKLLSQFTYSSQAIPSWACIVLHTNPPYAKYNHECLIALIYHYKFSPVVSSGLGVEAIPLDLCLLCLPNSELAILPEGAVVHHLADQANAKYPRGLRWLQKGLECSTAVFEASFPPSRSLPL